MASATVAWVSANTAVATVDGNGLVSAAGQGATNIVVTAGSTASASVGVMVEQVPHTVVLSIPLDSLAVGDSIQMTAEAFDALSNAIAGVTFEWSSSDTTIATVDQQGWIRAWAGGSVEITAAAGATAGAVAVVTAVQVPRAIVLSEPPDSLAVGDSIQMTAEALDGLGNPIANVRFEWSSSDTAIATVDHEGWVRARAGGSVEITAAAGATAGAVAVVTAVQVPRAIVLSEPPDSLAVGDSIQMTAEALDGLGNPIANVRFEWSSGDTTIVTVDHQGWVRARGTGSTEITVALAEVSVSRSLRVVGDRNRDERAALEAFYYATNGPEWTNNTNWLSDMPPGRWYGVTANAADRVVELRLNRNGLRGRLPAELAGIRDLAVLDLTNNEMTGEIPSELADLTGLTWLALAHNELTGSIPPELGRLTDLVHLSLGGNQLVGDIPPELGNITELYWLSLSSNELTGTIPTEIWDFGELRHLALGHNQLTGQVPPEVANLGKLESLWIPYAGLTGPIPSELGRLSQLEQILLVGNGLSGAIPPELGSLHSLEYLSLARNNLSGSIPPELGALSRLEDLGLDDNPLTGSIPPELGRLNRLRDLFLSGTRLSGPIPPELGNLTNIERMFLGGELTGRIPPELGNLAALRRLEIESISLTGPIPPELGKLANLTVLYLSGYGLRGSIPPELFNMKRLEGLTLVNTGLTGSIPPGIEKLTNLVVLQLVQQPGDFGRRGAGLTGPLPSALGKLTKLRRIRIGHHAFTGPLPPELGNLSNLEELTVAQAQGDQSRVGIGLVGAIPPEFGNLIALKKLSLDSNHLSGTVPAEIGALTGLGQLFISNNDLRGRVPDSFLNLDLEEFWWHGNSLCLPDTPAFQAWRRGIRHTLGPYCTANAMTAAEGAVQIVVQPIPNEPLERCTASGSGVTETGTPMQAEHVVGPDHVGK